MKVGELRDKIKDLPPDIEVVIFMPQFCNPKATERYMYYASDAKFNPGDGTLSDPEYEGTRTSIGGDELTIIAGEGFDY